MNRIKTILIEDEPLARKRLEKLVGKIAILEVIGSFENPKEATDVLATCTVDLILSDILMPEVDGITFLKTLSYKPYVVFITAHADFAVEGFELDVLDYIMKPLLTEERLLKAVDKVSRAIALERAGAGRQPIKIKDRNKTLFVDADAVVYVKAWGDYVQIGTEEGIHTMLCSMKEMERKLPWKAFVRIHRSYIVNIQHIKELDATKVLLKNGAEIPIGLQYRALLYSRMGID